MKLSPSPTRRFQDSFGATGRTHYDLEMADVELGRSLWGWSLLVVVPPIGRLCT